MRTSRMILGVYQLVVALLSIFLMFVMVVSVVYTRVGFDWGNAFLATLLSIPSAVCCTCNAFRLFMPSRHLFAQWRRLPATSYAFSFLFTTLFLYLAVFQTTWTRQRSNAGSVSASADGHVPRGDMPRLLNKPLPDLGDPAGNTQFLQAHGKKVLICFHDPLVRPSRHAVGQLEARQTDLRQHGIVLVKIEAAKLSDSDRQAWGIRSLPWLILADQGHVVRAEGFGVEELDKDIAATMGASSK